MKLSELKDWVNTLPEELMEFDVIIGEGGTIDDEYRYRLDKPITFALIDEETKEVVLGYDIDSVPHSIPDSGDVQKLLDGE